ncbi:MAG: hypothetical protein ABI947_08640 [Chloroflexota bacterium]
MEVIFGAGFGLTTSPATNSLMQSVPVPKTGFVAGMQQAMLVASIVMLVSAVLTFLFLPDVVERTPDVN